MDLLKYLEPMKNLPERFSNLAFWRGVRKLRDEVVNAFEYVDSWGENIEHTLANSGLKLISSVELSTDNTQLAPYFLFTDSTTKISYFNATINLSNITAPENAKFAYIFLECDISDLPDNVYYTVSTFEPVTPVYHHHYPIGTLAFKQVTGRPHIKRLSNAFIWFYG